MPGALSCLVLSAPGSDLRGSGGPASCQMLGHGPGAEASLQAQYTPEVEKR